MRSKDEVLHFYDEFSDLVFRICILSLKNRQDAYDAVQDVFLKLMQSDKKFESMEHAKAWLITVAANHCRNLVRGFWRKNRLDEDVYLLMDNGEGHVPEDKQALYALLQLPQKLKIPVFLHYYEGYSIEEVAVLLKENSSTMRSRIAKARELLKELIQEDK